MPDLAEPPARDLCDVHTEMPAANEYFGDSAIAIAPRAEGAE